MELVIGCGSVKYKRLPFEGVPQEFSNDVITLDFNSDHKPDVVWNLNNFPLPFEDNVFDEIHAYEVLEHLGSQGDHVAFFNLFNELHRIMKDGGLLFGTCPKWDTMWAWGDPSHSRIISHGTMIFLNQNEYTKQIGVTPMTDFRYIYKGDFEILQSGYNDIQYMFLLKKRRVK